jgi:predicted nucleic acid-binding protein
MAREFLDTNILVYAFTTDPRAAVAETIMARRCDISVQTLNEFVNVARRKLKMDWEEVSSALAAIKTVCGGIHPLDVTTHDKAVELAERQAFSIFDALMIATALNAGCTVFHSEDMQHDMIVDGRLRISNPFRSDI